MGFATELIQPYCRHCEAGAAGEHNLLTPRGRLQPQSEPSQCRDERMQSGSGTCSAAMPNAPVSTRRIQPALLSTSLHCCQGPLLEAYTRDATLGRSIDIVRYSMLITGVPTPRECNHSRSLVALEGCLLRMQGLGSSGTCQNSVLRLVCSENEPVVFVPVRSSSCNSCFLMVQEEARE
jgi:hypothetical protein